MDKSRAVWLREQQVSKVRQQMLQDYNRIRISSSRDDAEHYRLRKEKETGIQFFF